MKIGEPKTTKPYECGGRVTTWAKIKNTHYSQAQGRHEFFQRGKRTRSRSTGHITAAPAPAASK